MLLIEKYRIPENKLFAFFTLAHLQKPNAPDNYLTKIKNYSLMKQNDVRDVQKYNIKYKE